MTFVQKALTVVALVLSVAACSGTGTRQGDRALTGAAVGGAGGALIEKQPRTTSERDQMTS